MLKSYFKLAWRNLKKDKLFSFIHISGLALGMTVALLIGLWAWYMYSYNRFLPGYRQAYQVKLNFDYKDHIQTQSGATLPLADALRSQVPGIRYVAESDWLGQHGLTAGERKLYLRGGAMGADFFHIFPFPFVEGDAATALRDPYSIVLTQSGAKALFGSADALNKIVRYENTHDLKVTGVVKDPPGNSSFQFSFIIPFSYDEQNADWVKQSRTNWGNHSYPVYVGLEPNASPEQVGRLVHDLQQDNEHPTTAKIGVVLHPFAKWRLYAQFENGEAVGGYIEYVRIYSFIAVLVLLIACINFTNLSTARSEKRAREVGVRKVVGSERRDLIVQFLAESLVVAFIAFGIALLLAQLALPGFNSLFDVTLQMPFSNPVFWALMIGYVLLTGVLAGIRPAFYFSGFEPVKILKGTFSSGKPAAWSRRTLVVVQFACSFALIIVTLIVYQQVRHAQNRPAGFDKNGLVAADVSPDLAKNYEPLKNELLQSGLAASVTKSSASLDGFAASFAIKDWPGRKKDESLEMATTSVSDDYFKTVGMTIKEGRDFKGPIDTMSLVLNEAAVKRLRLSHPVNSLISLDYTQVPMRVIGVVQDAVMGSPFQAAVPTLFVYNTGWASAILVRLSPGRPLTDGVKRMGSVFGKYNPAYPFVYHFVDEEYEHKFDAEAQAGQLAALSATLAIVISCLGLLGLASYVAERRSKEIGIRKVMGATPWRLWRLLSTEFLLLVIISCVVASPVAYFLAHGWLAKYSYRVSIGPGVFILATVLALTITLITISAQIVKTALVNPVKSLRNA
ncbi:MAG TPA: ABC transporter permease [Puia sp.]|uniref:ABC transporter permease n=1 Tax=Puia sp. TaxID=2045100 RepID=UPI002C2D2021|nr:ABC transporter permease [Puia sp.]HVU99506.1 ABC transporter permease [Puia sp.]